MNKYQNLKYNSLSRWNSYWYQIKEVLDLNPKKILEIGIGSRVVYNYLKNLGVEVVCVDIDKETNPDFIASVEKLPFTDNQFDVILCAEILEHLPFEKFLNSLREIKRVTKNYVVLTLPHWGRHFSIDIRLPLLKRIRIAYKFDLLPIRHKEGEHFWEIGKKIIVLKKLKI